MANQTYVKQLALLDLLMPRTYIRVLLFSTWLVQCSKSLQVSNPALIGFQNSCLDSLGESFQKHQFRTELLLLRSDGM